MDDTRPRAPSLAAGIAVAGIAGGFVCIFLSGIAGVALGLIGKVLFEGMAILSLGAGALAGAAALFLPGSPWALRGVGCGSLALGSFILIIVAGNFVSARSRTLADLPLESVEEDGIRLVRFVGLPFQSDGDPPGGGDRYTLRDGAVVVNRWATEEVVVPGAPDAAILSALFPEATPRQWYTETLGPRVVSTATIEIEGMPGRAIVWRCPGRVAAVVALALEDHRGEVLVASGLRKIGCAGDPLPLAP